MRLFVEQPNRYLEIPRTGLPIKAVFYGPSPLAGPAARALCKLYGCELIDVKYMQQVRDDIQNRTYVTALVDAMLNNTRKACDTRRRLANTVAALRDAVGHWLWLNFGYGTAGSLRDSESAGGGEWTRDETSFEDCCSGDRTASFKRIFSLIHKPQLRVSHVLCFAVFSFLNWNLFFVSVTRGPIP